MTHDKHVSYTSYLKVNELLELQQPLSDGPEHDELLFITIHQVYELWFKQLLHEAAAVQVSLSKGDTHRSMAILGRMRTIMKTCVSTGHLGDHDPLAVQLFPSSPEFSIGLPVCSVQRA
jgi:tryptophan 2,3-dioxygenase